MKVYKSCLYLIIIFVFNFLEIKYCQANVLLANNVPRNFLCTSKIPFYSPENNYKFPEVNYNEKPKTYKVDRVIDGDTLCYIENGKSVSIRLVSIDCDESRENYRIYKQAYLTGRKIECVMKSGQAAKERLQAIVNEEPSGYIDLGFKKDEKTDKYGRKLGVAYKNGRNVNEELVKSGFCSAYEYKGQ